MKNQSELGKDITARRKQMKLRQKDMYLRIGMKAQQYQRLEAGADMTMSTLFRVNEGLKMEMVLVPDERLQLVKRLVEATQEEFQIYMQRMLEPAHQRIDDTTDNEIRTEPTHMDDYVSKWKDQSE